MTGEGISETLIRMRTKSQTLTQSRLFFPTIETTATAFFCSDEKSRDYVLKNIQNEKDPFLRSMMWGSLWDSVREGELDPRGVCGVGGPRSEFKL